MVAVTSPPPTLDPDVVSLYHVVDDLLARSPILIFYGPSNTPTANTSNNSRIQAHIYSPAGHQSYPRLTIAPSSPLYSAVNCLPREEQGDDISRGLAFSLYKYFAELPQNVRQEWENDPQALGKLRAAPALFSDAHAASLASRMVQVENSADIIKKLAHVMAEQSVSWQDLDVILPEGAINVIEDDQRTSLLAELEVDELMHARYGENAELVGLFGETTFLPTSRLRRAPSRPTALNRSTNFGRKQKENLRREMCELLDTEENYVSKIEDLLQNVAQEFRNKARSRDPTSTSPSEETLRELFPESLDKILAINSEFLKALTQVLHDTENAAIQDIESTPDTAIPYAASDTAAEDVTGTLALANCFRTWFPKFADCYSHYLKAHTSFPRHLRAFSANASSSFSRRVVETGEQKLTSMLIEPVQRLPRYNLYIDNLIKQLPVRHPALKALLNSRDIISGICAQDTSSVEPAQVVERLRQSVQRWPLELQPTGRLITIIDIIELPPPYILNPAESSGSHGMLLVFADHFVMLTKSAACAISSRGLLAQLDGSEVMNASIEELTFKQALEIASFDMTEADGGKAIQIIPHQTPSKDGHMRPASAATDLRIMIIHLSGAYEGKASKLAEELCKARVENRFTDVERESQKFEARAAHVPGLTFFSAICEPRKHENGAKSRQLAQATIWIQPPRGAVSSLNSTRSILLASITRTGSVGSPYRLEVHGPENYHFVDELSRTEFLPVLAKRCKSFSICCTLVEADGGAVRDALVLKSQIKHSPHTRILLLKNRQLLQALQIVTSQNSAAPKESRSRPNSPVKMLTSLFSAGASSAKDTATRRLHIPNLSLSDIPQLARPTSAGRTPDDESFRGNLTTPVTTQAASEHLSRLEDTLSSYVLAIQARKGNIVGKTLRMRHVANELQANELYNGLLEDHTNFELAAQMPIDVLFRAFENFVKVTWQDKMMPIVSQQVWLNAQARLGLTNTTDFDDVFRENFSNSSPQNQRALRMLVKLLRDLLEGASNDGDKGMMTACFAEILVTEGDPMDFVPVLDRLVEDYDHLLSTPMEYRSASATPAGSLSSASRHRAVNTGSLTSNTSSLRKKFGLLARKGSKSQPENEPESVSVWRTLSKSKHGSNDSQPSSLSRGTMQRNRSNESVTGLSMAPKRPSSRDRPTVLGAFPFESSRPLSTIGESELSGPPRKRRRSSLPDISTLRSSVGNTPTSMLRTPSKHDSPSVIHESPRTPSPTKASMIPQMSPGHNSSSKKENIPSHIPSTRVSPSRTLPRTFSPSKALATTASTLEDITSQQNSSTRRRTGGSVSGIPTLRPNGGLSERPSSGNVRKLPPTPGMDKITGIDKPAPLNPAKGKLRMQSPQKIRARLQEEHKAINDADASMQETLRQIGEELQQAGSTRSRPYHVRTQSAVTPSHANADVKALELKLATVGKQYASALTALKSQLESVKADTLTSLEVSERRAVSFDKLYQQAEAENVALYAQVNESLRSMAQQIKEGNAIVELKKRAEYAEDEAAKLRKENWRFKREVAGLRAQLKE